MLKKLSLLNFMVFLTMCPFVASAEGEAKKSGCRDNCLTPYIECLGKQRKQDTRNQDKCEKRYAKCKKSCDYQTQ